MPKHDPLMEGLNLRHKNWQSIANASQGQYRYHEIFNAAWIEAIEWTDPPFDPNNEAHWNLLGGIVRNKHVTFAEKNILYATQLDHAPSYLDDNDGQHPLLNQLSRGVDSDPLQQLINLEESDTDPYHDDIVKLGCSKLAGFLLLLRELGTTRNQSAQSLLMSSSWLYTCILRARDSDKDQQPLFNDPSLITPSQLHTWRPFKIKHSIRTSTTPLPPNQLSLAF